MWKYNATSKYSQVVKGLCEEKITTALSEIFDIRLHLSHKNEKIQSFPQMVCTRLVIYSQTTIKKTFFNVQENTLQIM